jgi:hypothetical protein
MALKNCKECGKEVSTKAKECPSCGAPVNSSIMTTNIGCFTTIVIIFAIIMIWSLFNNDTSDKATKTQPAAPKTQEEIRKEQIEKHFSAWDGSHRGLTEAIKRSMNDPSSYDHEKTVYWDKGDHLVVQTTFRGKNAFGGVVINSVMAKVDLNGNVIEIISEGP